MSTMLILGLVSAGVSAIGVMQSASAASAAASYNAQIADRDAVVADQNRIASIEQARVAGEDKSRENRRVLASMRAAYGASGLELAGSPLDVLTDTATEQGLDVRRIEYDGQIRGREGALQMMGAQESAALSRAEASSINAGAPLAAIGTLASGVGTTLQRTA